MNDTQRDYGIDCVKVLAIILVIAHHVIDFGCTIPDSAGTPLRFAWCFLRGIACTCVNLFVLVTGFLCVRSVKPGKHIARLWWQVLFTGLIVTAGFSLFNTQFKAHVVGWDWVRSVFPIITGEYWYFTAYFLLVIFMPIVNPGILAMERKPFQHLLFLLFLLLSVSSLFVNNDPFVLKNGYSFAWLLVMYLFGAFWRLHVAKPPPKILLIALLAACSMAFVIPSAGKRIFAGELGEWFGQINHVRFISPFNMGMSLAIFGLCRHIVVRNRCLAQMLAAVSAASLGMYLWLVHPVFWHAVWRPKLGSVVIAGLGQFLLHLTIIVITAFVAAFSLEFVRKKIFSFVSNAFDRQSRSQS